MAACKVALRLKTFSGLTPYEYICKIWTPDPDRFIANPVHQMPGLNDWPNITTDRHQARAEISDFGAFAARHHSEAEAPKLYETAPRANCRDRRVALEAVEPVEE